MMKNDSHFYKFPHQRGISSFIVMMMLVLAVVSVMVSQRLGVLNEAFLGSDSDVQRSFAAAEAVMQDAKLDVRGYRLGADGKTRTNCTSAGTVDSCRAPGGMFFPKRNVESYGILDLRARIPGGNSCFQGVCAPSSGPLAPFWVVESTLDTMKAEAAKYGQFTQTSTAGNDILANRAWYWIEVFEYNTLLTIAQPSGGFTPNQNSPFVFRITAIAEGKKPGSRTVLQTFYIPNLSDS